ncbi:MAG: aminoglycoside phosphotransferase family protein [Acidobacteriota bacterium]|nr:aminoglycoside phosphotransferase family protein [Acidobacteriota bacterium]
MNRKYFANLPERFTRNVLGLHAEKGGQWLEDLPEVVGKISEKWSLQMEKPFADLSYNFVAPCILSGGTKAVLKIGFPEKDSPLFGEQKALQIYNGNGAVKLLAFDANYCALLLERLIPGENLKSLCETDDERATEIAIEVMRRLRQKPPENVEFPTLIDWMSGLQTAKKVRFASRLCDKALNYFEELSNDSEENLLLHGDLHHENILSAGRESFLAIDPKGVVGNIGYEIGVFLNNQRRLVRSRQNLRQILEQHVRQFARSFEIEPQNLRKWAFLQAALSAWWVFEDNGTGWEKWTAYADIWEEIGV